MILGCVALSVVGGTVRAETPGDTDAEFFMALAYKQVAMMDDGYQAVALLVRGEFDLTDATAARNYLVERKIARRDWPVAADSPLTRGRLAYMVCQALGIKGGVTMRLFGPSQRYCLAECQYLELTVGGATYEHVSGGELVSVIDRADQYKESKVSSGEAEAAAPAAAPATTVTESPKAAAGPGASPQAADAQKSETPAAAPVARPRPITAPAAARGTGDENLPLMTPVEP
jgi:hypothetical protein